MLLAGSGSGSIVEEIISDTDADDIDVATGDRGLADVAREIVAHRGNPDQT